MGIACDLGSEQDIEAAIDATESGLGPIDVLISNAAAKSANLKEFFKPAEQFSLEAWREITAVNLDGSFIVMRNVARRMIAAGRAVLLYKSRPSTESWHPIAAFTMARTIWAKGSTRRQFIRRRKPASWDW